MEFLIRFILFAGVLLAEFWIGYWCAMRRVKNGEDFVMDFNGTEAGYCKLYHRGKFLGTMTQDVAYQRIKKEWYDRKE